MKRVTLAFEGFEDTPVEVTVSPVPMRAYFDFIARWPQQSTIEQLTAELDEFERLAAPSSNGTAFRDLDSRLALAVINAWAEQVRDVPLPLPLRRSGPPPFPEPSTVAPADHRKRRRS